MLLKVDLEVVAAGGDTADEDEGDAAAVAEVDALAGDGAVGGGRRGAEPDVEEPAECVHCVVPSLRGLIAVSDTAPARV